MAKRKTTNNFYGPVLKLQKWAGDPHAKQKRSFLPRSIKAEIVENQMQHTKELDRWNSAHSSYRERYGKRLRPDGKSLPGVPRTAATKTAWRTLATGSSIESMACRRRRFVHSERFRLFICRRFLLQISVCLQIYRLPSNNSNAVIRCQRSLFGLANRFILILFRPSSLWVQRSSQDLDSLMYHLRGTTPGGRVLS